MLFWCTLIIIFDGYDLVIYGVVLPLLMEQWQLSPYVAGLLGSSALFGMMFGAMGFGMLSDRLGRKKTILLCVTLFSLTTFINGFASTPWQFGVLRFIAGLGIGGVMPNVVSLMSEYSPRRIRSTLVALMFSGYAVGGMMSAGLGIWIVPNYGWEVMFFLAVVPLLMLPLMVRFLPESVAFLMAQKREGEARSILQRLAPGRGMGELDRLQAPAAAEARAPVLELFRSGRALSTLMFWLAFFCCLLMVYALGSWLPKLMSMAGYALSSSLMFLMVLNIGAIIGAVGGGWLADRFSLRSVLVSFFVLGSVSLVLLGHGAADVVPVHPDGRGRSHHHRFPDSAVCLCGAVLSRRHSFHWPGLGFRHRPQRCHRRPPAGWPAADPGTAPPHELPGAGGAGGHCHPGRGDGRPPLPGGGRPPGP